MARLSEFLDLIVHKLPKNVRGKYFHRDIIHNLVIEKLPNKKDRVVSFTMLEEQKDPRKTAKWKLRVMVYPKTGTLLLRIINVAAGLDSDPIIREGFLKVDELPSENVVRTWKLTK